MIRSDGTSVYMTQDIGTAIQRFRDYPSLSGVVYIVGNEQNHHFNVLFKILQKLDFEWAIIPYVSKEYTWVEKTIIEIKNFLETNKIPSSNKDCDLCKYMSKFFNFIKKPNLL